MITYELTADQPESQPLEFEYAAIIIEGTGTVELYRQIGDVGFYPVTDASGERVQYSGTEEVLANFDIENPVRGSKYKVVMQDASPQDKVKVIWRSK